MKKFPDYRIVKINDNYFIERKIYKDYWIKTYDMFLIRLFTGIFIFSMIITYYAIISEPNMFLFLLFNFIAVPIFIESFKNFKFDSIENAEKNIKKKLKKHIEKTKKNVKYFSVNIVGESLTTEEFNSQEIRKEKLRRLS